MDDRDQDQTEGKLPFRSVSSVTYYQLKSNKIIFSSVIQPFPKRQIFYSSKLDRFADDNFKFDETGRKFSKQVENTAEQEGQDGPGLLT